MEELIPGLFYEKNPKNKFAVIKLHYTADPDKATPEWKARAQAGMPEADWQREYEINFEQQRGKRVIAEYDPIIHQKEIEINKFLPLLRSWDFGYRRPACVISQINPEDQWCIHYEFLGQDVLFEKFVQMVIDSTPQEFEIEGKKDKVRYKDFCDPAGTQRSDKSERTSIEILNAFKIYPSYKKSNPGERARIMRSKFPVRPDGKPGVLIHPRCKIIDSGLMGGWHFPEVSFPGHEDEPEKDGFYEHIFDALGYKAFHIFKYFIADPTKARLQRPKYVQRSYNRFTGS